jgi:hypothetical protein
LRAHSHPPAHPGQLTKPVAPVVQRRKQQQQQQQHAAAAAAGAGARSRQHSPPATLDPLAAACTGDVITLFDTHHQGYMVADGFNNPELVFQKMATPDPSCYWKVINKLNYQHAKRFKKHMKQVGLPTQDIAQAWEMFDEEFCTQHDVSQSEKSDLMDTEPKYRLECEQNAIKEQESFGQPLIYGMPIQVREPSSRQRARPN